MGIGLSSLGKVKIFFNADRLRTWISTPPMFSKIERGERRAKREQVLLLAKLLNTDTQELLTLWLAEQVYDLVKDEDVASNALKVAEEDLSKFKKPVK